MSRRLIESVERLLGIFRAIAEQANPKTGSSPRLPDDEVEALAVYLAGRGHVLSAGALRREYNRLLRSLTRGSTILGCPYPLKERQIDLRTAVDRIVRLLEELKRDASVKEPRADTQPKADQSRGKGKKPPKVTVEARMYDLIRKDHTTHTWTARQFATYLGCSVGSVGATSAWKELMVAREMARLERAEREYNKRLSKKTDRRRKPMHRSETEADD